MKYFIIAGEASGDLHGSLLMQSLKSADPDAQFAHWGGDRMAAEAGAPYKHVRDLAFMGFAEVVMNLRTILGFMKSCKQQIKAYHPDAIILIDYPGFNLRMAKWAKKQGYQVYYFISPQVWAWKAGRVKTVDRYVDRMYGILPFEPKFYADRGVEIDYFGHPLVTEIDRWRDQHEHDPTALALLPGSRQQEVKTMLPLMLDALSGEGHDHVLISQAPTLPTSLYDDILKSYPDIDIKLHQGSSYALLAQAKAALVTSGTATLETALFGVPQVVCYKGSVLSYFFAKQIVDIAYISLVNLICDRPIVKELIQSECNTTNIRKALSELYIDEIRNQMATNYAFLRERLTPPSSESPTDLVAADIVRRMKAQP